MRTDEDFYLGRAKIIMLGPQINCINMVCLVVQGCDFVC